MEAQATAHLKYLSYDPPVSSRAALLQLADYAGDRPMDRYGMGITEELETKLCDMLGMDAAVYMPAGKTAQNIAFKLWARRIGCDRIAVHPRSHVEEWEEKAYSQVFGLSSVALGPWDRQVKAADLDSLREPVAVAAVEIALRPLGCVVVEWDELCELSRKARKRGIPFHGDGARIWESQAHYKRPLRDIAALFDSIYVSLYKGIGGLAGAALLGSRDFINEARVWQQRLGQKQYRQFPYVLAALQGIEKRLPRMEEFRAVAQRMAKAIRVLDNVMVSPQTPHTNAFLVALPGDPEKLLAARDRVASKTGLWLFDSARPSFYEGQCLFEVHVGVAATQLADAEVVRAIALLRDSIGMRSTAAADHQAREAARQ